MYRKSVTENQLSIDFASKTHYLGKTIDLIQEFLREKVNRSDYGYHSILVVCHELLKNALFHGNREDERKAIHITVRRKNSHRFMITVKDEGPGFDIGQIDHSLPDDPKHLSQKGYILISTLAREMIFNDKGNQITVEIEVDREKKKGA